ncbi:ExbD/TolR family protein [Flavobacterium wongokense]|uniref:ExbD/TolR family protein n=1 Tax=Flavobacterium wongokense TaxID=2910674 RepID=UPI001F3279EA|nr:biopolymer transporter ExbD [Flavobacterium sp. WG47]MCF6133346.1 biopolymer transporter ExbD [Flavobacterium sp. WG47]
MAELNTGDSGKGKGGKVRSKKSNAKVDLTAMVDLAFLLITFFMLTTSLSKPQSMDLGLPDKEDDPTKNKDIKVDQRRTMTILMGDNDKIKWYHGLLETPEPNGKPTDAVYGRNGLRKEILKRVTSVPQVTGDKEKGLIVIIKPSKKSTYRNLVDVLDEMAICKVPTYAIVNDITPEEMKLVDEMNK